MGVGAQRVPLAEEEELQESVERDVARELAAVSLHGLRLAQTDILVLPLDPAAHAEMRLEGHEQRIVFQPRGVLRPEGGKFRGIALDPALIGLAQHGKAAHVDRAVVGALLVRAPEDVLDFAFLQQPVADQQIEINVVGVARKGGEGGVWTVAVTGRPQGKKLPVTLAGTLEKIYETIGALAHRTDPVRGGERAHRHQNAAGSVHDDPSF